MAINLINRGLRPQGGKEEGGKTFKAFGEELLIEGKIFIREERRGCLMHGGEMLWLAGALV